MAGWLNWKESPGKKKWGCAAEFAPGLPVSPQWHVLADVLAYPLPSADIKLSSLCKEDRTCQEENTWRVWERRSSDSTSTSRSRLRNPAGTVTAPRKSPRAP